MKPVHVGALILAMGTSALMAAEMPWAKDWESAAKAAADSNRMTMVSFMTDW
jgi:hypothetical protein